MDVLQLTEQGVDNDPGGVVNRQQQCELRSVFPKPSVVAAVYLYQHTLARHTLPPHSMLRRPTPTRAAHPCAHQYAPQRAPADVYALPLPEQLTQVRVVDSGVSGPSQTYCFDRQCARCSIGRAATSVAVSYCGCSLLSVCRQYAPGMACAQSHQCRCLLRRHMPRQ